MRTHPLLSVLALVISAALFAWKAFGLVLNGQPVAALGLALVPVIAGLVSVFALWRHGWRTASHHAGRAGLFGCIAVALYVLMAGALHHGGHIRLPDELFTVLLCLAALFFLWQIVQSPQNNVATAAVYDRRWHLGFVIFALIYGVIAVRGALAYADAMNPDGIAYMQIAQQLAAGEFVVRAYWAPLYSYLMVPFLWLNLEVVTAAHLTSNIVLLGGFLAIYIVGLQMKLHPLLSLCVVLLTLPLTLPYSLQAITPDALEICVIFLYFVAVLRALARPVGWRWGVLCGVAAALAYYGRSYALPFFVIHFSLTVFLLIGFKLPRVSVLKAWLAGMLTCALLVAPWIIAISGRTGNLTLSTASAGNRTIVAPVHPYGGVGGNHAGINCWVTYPCMQPADVLFPWEDHDPAQLARWSPLESLDNLRHQVAIINENVAGRFSESDTVYLLVIVIVAACACLCLLRNAINRETFLLVFLALSALIYLGGYTTTYSTPARYHWVPMIFSLLLMALALDRALQRTTIMPKVDSAQRHLPNWQLSAAFFATAAVFVGLIFAVGMVAASQSDPIRVEVQQAGTSGYVAADQSLIISGCVMLRWRLDGINAVFLNEAGITGVEQSRELCDISMDASIVFRVVHLDGTESTYELAPASYWDMPAVHQAFLVAIIAIVAGLLFGANALTNGLSSEQTRPSVRRSLQATNVVLVGACLVYLVGAIYAREWTPKDWEDVFNPQAPACNLRDFEALQSVIEAPFIGDSGFESYVSFLTQTRSYGSINPAIFDMPQRQAFITETGALQFLTRASDAAAYSAQMGMEPLQTVTFCNGDYVLLRVPQAN